ncbi:MAG TPA: LLM class flavin-dependent oxidoreductase, partial [Actinobacteria bacterium]|nr:LLM class flavin-dependent oxidoreductase [Actinomycetota bacterium]
MTHPRVAVGLGLGTSPPVWRPRTLLRLARVMHLHSAWTVDHFLGFFPQQIWNRDLTWTARPGSSPHEYFDYQVLLGHLASRAGNVRLGVGVTEALRRHPVLI